MQRPDARTCIQPGHEAAFQAPKVRTAVIVLFAGLFILGTIPSLTFAMSLHPPKLSPSLHLSPSSPDSRPALSRSSHSLESSYASFLSSISSSSSPARGVEGRDNSSRLIRHQRTAPRERTDLRSTKIDPSSDKAGAPVKQGHHTNLTHQLSNQERQSRSLSMSTSVHNDYWVFFDVGRFLYVAANGTVGTTMDLKPADGLLQVTVTSTPLQNSSIFRGGQAEHNVEPLATLKGRRSNKFVCMDKRGRFYARDLFLEEDCVFRQKMQKNWFITLCRDRERKKPKKTCRFVCMGVNSKHQLKRYCESAGETFLQLLPKKEQGTEKGLFSISDVSSRTTPPPNNKGDNEGPVTPSRNPGDNRRKKNRRKNNKRKKGRRKGGDVDKPCHGLFCKPSTDRPGSELPRSGRDHRRRRRRRKNRHRRRQQPVRPRRAEKTPEEGPFANVT